MKIDRLDDLRQLYGPAKERSVKKQMDRLDVHCRRFISLSPFVVLSSGGADGRQDASPRGGKPGFVLAPDERTLLIPDAMGNNRLDTLENIIANGQLGLLFMLPGMDETLRVNGRAELRNDADLIQQFAGERTPKLVIRVSVLEAYLHCAKALMRSRLWSPQSQVDRSVLPTMGQMLHDQIGISGPAETQEQMLARYVNEL